MLHCLPGTTCQVSWHTVWILQPRNGDVHLHTTPKPPRADTWTDHWSSWRWASLTLGRQGPGPKCSENRRWMPWLMEKKKVWAQLCSSSTWPPSYLSQPKFFPERTVFILAAMMPGIVAILVSQQNFPFTGALCHSTKTHKGTVYNAITTIFSKCGNLE
jgi:hypothetical protein